MVTNELTQKFLCFFYKLGEPIALRNPQSFLSENQLTENDLRNILSYVCSEGYLEYGGIPQLYRITKFGMLFLEQNDAFPQEILRHHNLLRYRALSSLAELGGTWACMDSVELSNAIDTTDKALYAEMTALHHRNLVKPRTHKVYSITEEGLKWQKLMQLKYDSLAELEKVSKLSPQKRGIHFQRLVFRQFELRLWNPEESVKTSNEEIDVFIHKNLSFYLVECKWEKNPIGTDPVTHLFEKIRIRSGANGILLSMSGFTKGAVEAVETRTSDKLLLLFGKQDIEEMFEEFHAFEELLEEKTRELISRRVAKWK